MISIFDTKSVGTGFKNKDGKVLRLFYLSLPQNVCPYFFCNYNTFLAFWKQIRYTKGKGKHRNL